MKSLKLLIASAILLPGIASPPDVFSKDAAASLEATYSLRNKNKSTGAVATMTIFGQRGAFFRIKGDQWDGLGSVEGDKGRYDWKFSDGRSGRTTFTVQGDGSLIGHVQGSGIDWVYIATPVTDQAAVDWTQVSARGRLLAKRAAQLDAYREMGSMISEMRLAGNATVSDFINDSEEARAAFKGVIRGARLVEHSKARDGYLVVMELDRETLIKALSNVAQRIPEGKKWAAESFDKLRSDAPRVIRATGIGLPSKKYIR